MGELATYNLSRLTLSLDDNMDDEELQNHLDGRPELKECQNVMVRFDGFWPNPRFVGLDDSQFAALKAALTQQFVVIQGPPGVHILPPILFII